MTKYPTEQGEIVDFTPDSLDGIPVPPVFKLRPVTERGRRTLKKLTIKEGLRSHSLFELRKETINGLRELWSEEVFNENEGRLRAFWDASDQHERAQAGKDKPEPFEHPDMAAMVDLSDRVSRSWPPLCTMLADNDEFQSTWPKLIACVVVAGWSGLDARYSRDEGLVTLESVDAAAKAMQELEAKALADQVEGVGLIGTAFLQLLTRCTRLFALSQDEEKNSASPSMSSETQNTSKTDGVDQTDGSSTALNTTETPAA